MSIKVAAGLFVAFALASVPVSAHDRDDRKGDHLNSALARAVAALTERVSKLEGNLESADLAGTYSLSAFQSDLLAMVPATPTPQRNAIIGVQTSTGTVTVNADGTGSFAGSGNGSVLIQGLWTLNATQGADAGTFTWTYANGIMMVALDDGNHIELAVGPAGRLLVGARSALDAVDQHATSLLVVLTRR